MECNTDKCPAHMLAQNNERRIEELERVKLSERLVKIETIVEVLEGNVDKILLMVEKLNEKPARRWEMLIGALITAGAGLAIGFLIGG